MKKYDAVYIHVPFCTHICDYCDFCKVIYNREFVRDYLISLAHEMSLYPREKCSSVYLGGGTPSALAPSELNHLLQLAKSYLEKGGQFCIEINPDSCDEQKIEILKEHGINRVSIGVQTFTEKYRKLLNRQHSNEDVKTVIQNLKSAGITNISVDLMFGFPTQTYAELQVDLDNILKLGISHVSCYPLVIEEHTVFHNKNIQALDEDGIYDMYEIINKVLAKNGFKRYEISNFAKDGKISKHNIKYWKDENYLGLGPGASGYLDNVRYDNSKSLTDYLKFKYDKIESLIVENEHEFEYIMLNLRLVEGIDFLDYKRKFNKKFLEVYCQEVKMLMDEGLLKYDDTHLYVTEKGTYLTNYVITSLTMKLTY